MRYSIMKTPHVLLSVVITLVCISASTSFAAVKHTKRQAELANRADNSMKRGNQDMRHGKEIVNNAAEQKENAENQDPDLALLDEQNSDQNYDDQFDELDANSIIVSDPFESFNRSAYKLNKKVDDIILKPAAEIYRGAVPAPVRTMIGNFYNNMAIPATVANDLLQGDFYYAASDAWRFLINSTVGIAGMVDVATSLGLPSHKTDFGITLAKWGYRKSNYLVVPFWGPSSFRDFAGVTVDYYAFSFYPYIQPKTDRYLLIAGYAVVYRAEVLDFQDVLDQAEFDPYVFERNAFIQRRNFLLEDSEEHTGFEPINYTPLPPQGYLPVNPIKARI